MRLARTKNTIKNTIWGVISKIVTLLLPFFARMVFIRTLGAQYLGLSSLFASILTVLNMAELGIGSAIVFSMYKPIADNDEDLLCALMSFYKKVYRVIGFVVLFVGIALIPFLPKLVNGDLPDNINLYYLYFIYLAEACCSYWLFAYRNCLLNVYQRNDVINKVSVIMNTLLRVIQICVLVIFPNYYVYAIFQPLFVLLINCVNGVITLKMFPHLHCKGKISKALRNDIWRRVSGLMFNKIAYASRNAFDSMIVSAFIGLYTVAMYNNYYYIINSVSGIMLVLMQAMAAGIGNSLSLDSKEKNENDMCCINFIYISMAYVASCCMIALYQPFMKLWMGDEYLFSQSIMLLFAGYFLIEKTENVIGQYYDSAGLWWHGKWKGFIEAGVNLVLDIVLCKYFGVIGIILATVISIILVSVPLSAYYMYKYYYEKSCKRFLMGNFMYLIPFFIGGIIVYFSTCYIPYGKNIFVSLCLMVLRLLITIIISTVFYLLVFKKTKIFRRSFDWIDIHFHLKKRVKILKNIC